MRKSVQSTFQVQNWDEKTYDEVENGPRLTRATVTKTFSGDIEGKGVVEYLMVHQADGTATFLGLERVTGTLDGKSGSFVLEHSGTFEKGIAKADCNIVAGSGTGELEKLNGKGGFSAEGREAPFNMEYEIG